MGSFVWAATILRRNSFFKRLLFFSFLACILRGVVLNVLASHEDDISIKDIDEEVYATGSSPVTGGTGNSTLILPNVFHDKVNGFALTGDKKSKDAFVKKNSSLGLASLISLILLASLFKFLRACNSSKENAGEYDAGISILGGREGINDEGRKDEKTFYDVKNQESSILTYLKDFVHEKPSNDAKTPENKYDLEPQDDNDKAHPFNDSFDGKSDIDTNGSHDEKKFLAHNDADGDFFIPFKEIVSKENKNSFLSYKPNLVNGGRKGIIETDNNGIRELPHDVIIGSISGEFGEASDDYNKEYGNYSNNGARSFEGSLEKNYEDHHDDTSYVDEEYFLKNSQRDDDDGKAHSFENSVESHNAFEATDTTELKDEKTTSYGDADSDKNISLNEEVGFEDTDYYDESWEEATDDSSNIICNVLRNVPVANLSFDRKLLYKRDPVKVLDFQAASMELLYTSFWCTGKLQIKLATDLKDGLTNIRKYIEDISKILLSEIEKEILTSEQKYEVLNLDKLIKELFLRVSSDEYEKCISDDKFIFLKYPFSGMQQNLYIKSLKDHTFPNVSLTNIKSIDKLIYKFEDIHRVLMEASFAKVALQNVRYELENLDKNINWNSNLSVSDVSRVSSRFVSLSETLMSTFIREKLCLYKYIPVLGRPFFIKGGSPISYLDEVDKLSHEENSRLQQPDDNHKEESDKTLWLVQNKPYISYDFNPYEVIDPYISINNPLIDEDFMETLEEYRAIYRSLYLKSLELLHTTCTIINEALIRLSKLRTQNQSEHKFGSLLFGKSLAVEGKQIKFIQAKYPSVYLLYKTLPLKQIRVLDQILFNLDGLGKQIYRVVSENNIDERYSQFKNMLNTVEYIDEKIAGIKDVVDNI